MVCLGGGRCSGQEANSAEQVVGTQSGSEVCGCGYGSLNCNKQQVSGHGSSWLKFIFSAKHTSFVS